MNANARSHASVGEKQTEKQFLADPVVLLIFDDAHFGSDFQLDWKRACHELSSL